MLENTFDDCFLEMIVGSYVEMRSFEIEICFQKFGSANFCRLKVALSKQLIQRTNPVALSFVRNL